MLLHRPGTNVLSVAGEATLSPVALCHQVLELLNWLWLRLGRQRVLTAIDTNYAIGTIQKEKTETEDVTLYTLARTETAGEREEEKSDNSKENDKITKRKCVLGLAI